VRQAGLVCGGAMADDRAAIANRSQGQSGRHALPYVSNDDLPPSVGNHLPPHAQDIFREAFNHAWEQHGGDEATSFRIAWAAVKRRYRKAGDRWVPIAR
jgi:cation transport regulator